MINKTELEPLLDEFVSVGVAHYDISFQLFFYYGFLRYIDDLIIKLETKNGYKIVRLCKILDIHKTERKQ